MSSIKRKKRRGSWSGMRYERVSSGDAPGVLLAEPPLNNNPGAPKPVNYGGVIGASPPDNPFTDITGKADLPVSDEIAGEVEFYVDRGGKHRWRVTSSNGEIVASSSQGYKQKASAVKNADKVLG